MKLVTFNVSGQTHFGALREINGSEKIFSLHQLDVRLPDDIIEFLNGGDQTLALAQKALASAAPEKGIDLASVKLLAPLPKPGKLICIGQNYLEHAKESGNIKAPYPIIFAKYNNSVVGPGDAIVIPSEVKKPDYEGELAVVIGRRGRSIPQSEALAHIGGYTVLNDVSARDWQNRTSQWVIGKTCDTFCPIGPVMVTADEIPDPQNLHLRTLINGEELQNGWTGDMLFPIAELIADMSRVMTLDPGDVIATGTPPGVGFARVPPRWLRPGDLVRIEIEKVGVLENPVIAEG